MVSNPRLKSLVAHVMVFVLTSFKIIKFCGNADILHVFSTVPRDLNFIEHMKIAGWKM